MKNLAVGVHSRDYMWTSAVYSLLEATGDTVYAYILHAAVY